MTAAVIFLIVVWFLCVIAWYTVGSDKFGGE